jgi:TetR/AcrR family transcriptional regulator, regulator of cefoperazone and chloramphenicol sensitivity
MTEKTSTRQAILEAVVACIESHGIEKLTTRRIAEAAGTNLAAINYHFGTKDELVAQALAMTIQHMLEDVITAIDEVEPFGSMIEEVFFYLIDGSRRFPGVTTAHLYAIVVRQEYDSAAGRAMRDVLVRLLDRAAEEYPDDDGDELGFALAQVFAAILFTMIAPGYLPVAERYQLADDGDSNVRHRALARRYTSMLFACWGKSPS